MLMVKDVSLSLRQTTLLHNVSFTVQPGEILTLMGPSGSGKSSLFAWMVGALPADLHAEGELWINARRCDTLPTEQRGLGLLFQDALLFDHFSVGQNLLLALPASVKGAARKQQVNDALDAAELSGFFHRDPATLSGGQRARIGLLRALLAQPQALLLDEPFSRLDKTLRDQFRRWVFAEVRSLGIPVVQVTHDEDDVPSGGRVLAMEKWQ
ncbi:ATP-binding cassette domain-containing protein [Leclercia adecarboxylata]|uniref:ATP-binding cassette domain-containing protein n=1 Tax=Leclercia adecarboxylata TaxID=83655 RepID=UPI00111AFDEC|nr:ATP-binding cassette domain-containing protein [Leclercia adecarboxylata]QCZ28960.1 ATP-binding cassette domain-containing protein [Leclercia adecarboxylata]